VAQGVTRSDATDSGADSNEEAEAEGAEASDGDDTDADAEVALILLQRRAGTPWWWSTERGRARDALLGAPLGLDRSEQRWQAEGTWTARGQQQCMRHHAALDTNAP